MNGVSYLLNCVDDFDKIFFLMFLLFLQIFDSKFNTFVIFLFKLKNEPLIFIDGFSRNRNPLVSHFRIKDDIKINYSEFSFINLKCSVNFEAHQQHHPHIESS